MNPDPHSAVILDLSVPRFFNLLEAERLLPEVERLIRSLVASKQEYEEADGQLNTHRPTDHSRGWNDPAARAGRIPAPAQGLRCPKS